MEAVSDIEFGKTTVGGDTVIPENITIDQSPELPDNLQKIVNALSEYHKVFLHKNTLTGQEPVKLEKIRNYLKEVCCQICDYIEDSNNIPSFLGDADFKKMFDVLKENTKEWDSDISILIPYWCNLMFVQYPFSISQQHIESLMKNSKKSNVESDDI
jgi:hypothetical protein